MLQAKTAWSVQQNSFVSFWVVTLVAVVLYGPFCWEKIFNDSLGLLPYIVKKSFHLSITLSLSLLLVFSQSKMKKSLEIFLLK